MDSEIAGCDGPSLWGPLKEPDAAEFEDEGLLRDIMMPGKYSASEFPPSDGHCYLNTIEKLIIQDIVDKNVKEGGSLNNQF
jgi:hypothetical protein